MTIPTNEKAPGGDRRRGPEDKSRASNVLSIVALARESTLKMRVFCQLTNRILR